MKDNIFSICLGNNLYNLYGCKNDSIIFYNFLYKLYKNKNLKENWMKPNILFNKDVAVDNINKLINESECIIDKILIFYSGHGYRNKTLNIRDKSINKKKVAYRHIIKKINDNLSKDIELYIILDSCYSGKFELLPFDKIKKISLISSTLPNQKSTESFISIDQLNLQNDFIKYLDKNSIYNDNIVVGTFTYHFVDILNKLSVNNLNDFKLVFYDKRFTNIWISIGIIGKQFPKIIW